MNTPATKKLAKHYDLRGIAQTRAAAAHVEKYKAYDSARPTFERLRARFGKSRN